MSVITSEIGRGVVLAGRYRVLRRIGAGGMATVFLAEDERLGREVAVKRLHTDAPEASLRRFEDEARLGAALNHPNLVAVYDTVADEHGALIVMEYVPGKSLSEVARGRAMRPARAMPILSSVAEALDHAHAQGVVHRDVKPGNVIVGDDGTVKLADLGIARAIGANQITSEGQVVGTLPYMAPERLARPGAGGPESDVYALAAVAYELLSGKPPSEASSTGEAAAQEPLDLAREWPKGPPAAVAVLERGLDDEPDARPPSARRFVDDLGAALDRKAEPATAPATTRVATRERPAAVPPARPRPKLERRTGPARSGSPSARSLAIAAIALGLLAAVGIAAGAGGGGDGGEQGATADAKSKQKPKPEPKPQPAADTSASAAAPADDGASAADDPAALNDLGFQLINEGRYEEAIPVLQRAVDSFPDGSQDLTYAYALFNLGHALRLAGRPEEAIPVLEKRLEIPNQTDEVQRELDAARAEAGVGDQGDEGPGNGHGNAFGHDKHGEGD